jgi:hypothetical protein
MNLTRVTRQEGRTAARFKGGRISKFGQERSISSRTSSATRLDADAAFPGYLMLNIDYLAVTAAE